MPSREDILAAYQAGPDAVIALVAQLLAVHAGQIEQLVSAHERQASDLTARVAQLEAHLNKDSHNSHQPPASDPAPNGGGRCGPAKRPHPRSLRRRSGKKSGGQPGHPGVTRCLVDQPDTVAPHVPATCAACGASLETAPEIRRDRRQVLDLPEPRLEVTEHQAAHKVCPVCQTVTAGAFPPEVSQPVQYGPRTKAAAVYLQTYQLLPYKRTAEALGDLFGVYPSEGTLASAQATAYTALEPVEQASASAIRQADVVPLDEAGQRVAGYTEWVHVASTAMLTFYAHTCTCGKCWCHAKRGREAIIKRLRCTKTIGRNVIRA